ncbi:ThuA domain-containing protein [Seonamhaeicola sp.]|uniref:ThuA domain-containing protein n=1 Tax=Seonamhaeicola sp. TaxID=1912245 RepID=UPI002638546A|nr:ThuA domain-containing protein [Seonamhaeicola sp.]
MKLPNYFLIALVFVCSCKEKSSNAKTDSNVPIEGVQQWISYEGEENKPKIVLVSGDEEYRSEEALPMMAKILTEKHGFNCTVLFAQDPQKPGILNPNNVNNIPGLSQLESADLMVLFTRFRALPDDQMRHIDSYLKAGKPVIGIRTATHAFNFEDGGIPSSYKHYGNFYETEGAWKGGFGRLVLGEKWISHHGVHRHQSTKGIAAPEAQNHPILNGIADGEIWGPSDVYGVRLPLPGDSKPIVLGQAITREGAYDPKDPLFGMRSSDYRLATTNLIEIEEEEEENVADGLVISYNKVSGVLKVGEKEFKLDDNTVVEGDLSELTVGTEVFAEITDGVATHFEILASAGESSAEDDEEDEDEDEDEEIAYNPNEPLMPIAWTKSYKLPEGIEGKAFATTIGASTDLLSEGTRRLLVNAVFWSLEMEVPEKADVSIIGDYKPTAFEFLDNDHWEKLNRSISSMK